MGGTDITSTAYSNGVITISKVTGNVVITGVAIKDTYTNLIPLSTSTVGGTEIFNGTGYQDGKYISGGNLSNDSACVTSGYMPYACTKTYAPTIYMKGITLDTSISHVRIEWVHNSTPSGLVTSGTSIDLFFTIETLGTNYYKLTPLSTVNESHHQNTHMRWCVKGTGANWIVSLNKEID